MLFTDVTGAFHRAGNVPQLIITLASVPALFERLDRFEPAATLLGAMSCEPSSFHHVSDSAGSRIGSPQARHDGAEELDRRGRIRPRRRGRYARRQIDTARRDPDQRPTGRGPVA